MDLSAFFESDVPVEVQKNEEFLAKLDEEGWRRFLSVAQRLTFRANETVVSQADISRTFYPFVVGSTPAHPTKIPNQTKTKPRSKRSGFFAF